MSTAASRSLRVFFCSSIGKKQVMAVTGLALCGFLITHLLGNLLLFVGADAFNFYAHKLTSNSLIYIAEAGLGGVFLLHLFLALSLTVQNKMARPENYVMKKRTGRGATWASSSMPYSGFIILIFLILHLLQFKFGPVYMTTVDGIEMRDMYQTVIEYFSTPLNLAWYIVAMTVMAFHVGHGFSSTFQSLGFNHPKYTPCIKKLGIAYSVFVATGFAGVSIYCFLQN